MKCYHIYIQTAIWYGIEHSLVKKSCYGKKVTLTIVNQSGSTNKVDVVIVTL